MTTRSLYTTYTQDDREAWLIDVLNVLEKAIQQASGQNNPQARRQDHQDNPENRLATYHKLRAKYQNELWDLQHPGQSQGCFRMV